MQTPASFEVLCEIEPPTTPDLAIVREQIAVLQPWCDAFLVPDSHLGRATVSSIAVAHEVAYLRGRAVACLNARDRNLLGLRRDLLTARAYGVRELLFVYGDQPSEGDRAPMTVRRMLAEVRESAPDLRIGVAADLTKPLPEWKRDADFLCIQLSFDPLAVEQWCHHTAFEGRIYAGVVVFASHKMAVRLMQRIPGLVVPERRQDVGRGCHCRCRGGRRDGGEPEGNWCGGRRPSCAGPPFPGDRESAESDRPLTPSAPPISLPGPTYCPAVARWRPRPADPRRCRA
jgi:methylenetetrahydrofolate reductase (NADPH)